MIYGPNICTNASPATPRPLPSDPHPVLPPTASLSYRWTIEHPVLFRLPRCGGTGMCTVVSLGAVASIIGESHHGSKSVSDVATALSRLADQPSSQLWPRRS